LEKKDKTNRLCIDYRKLNQITVDDKYPMHRHEDSFNKLAKCKYFTSLDFVSGYWQIGKRRRQSKNSIYLS